MLEKNSKNQPQKVNLSQTTSRKKCSCLTEGLLKQSNYTLERVKINLMSRVRGVEDPLCPLNLSTDKLTAGITGKLTLQLSDLPPPKTKRGICLLQNHLSEFRGFLPPIQPQHQFSPKQRESTVQKGLGLCGDVTKWFLVAGQLILLFFFKPYLHKAKLPLSAGAKKVFSPASQGTSHLYNSTAIGALAVLISLTATSLFRKQHAAGGAHPGLTGATAALETARKQTRGGFITIVLREEPTCLQVKLLLTDLLLEPELQVGPVPRGEWARCRHHSKRVVPNPPQRGPGPGQRRGFHTDTVPTGGPEQAAGRRAKPAAPRPGPTAPPRPGLAPPPHSLLHVLAQRLAQALLGRLQLAHVRRHHRRAGPRQDRPPPSLSPAPQSVAKRDSGRKGRRRPPVTCPSGWPHRPGSLAQAQRRCRQRAQRSRSCSHAGPAAGRRGAQLRGGDHAGPHPLPRLPGRLVSTGRGWGAAGPETAPHPGMVTGPSTAPGNRGSGWPYEGSHRAASRGTVPGCPTGRRAEPRFPGERCAAWPAERAEPPVPSFPRPGCTGEKSRSQNGRAREGQSWAWLSRA